MNVKPFLKLGKPQITLPVTLSALTGFVLFRESLAWPMLAVLTGVFLLSASSSVINAIQEVRTDRLMNRTRNRPIPSGQITKTTAWVVSGVLGLAGACLLWTFGGPLPAALGFFALLWYNGVYTPLKKYTAFAVVPGSLVGALPPVIGWTAAGGELWHPHIMMVAFFFFVGQIPHFWLILLKHGPDYENAGFPTLSGVFSRGQQKALTLGWIAATAMSALLLPLFGAISTHFFSVALLLATLTLLFAFFQWFKQKDPARTGLAFHSINFFYLLVMLALIGDALVR